MSALGLVTRALAPRFNELEPVLVLPDLIAPLWLALSALAALGAWWTLKKIESVDADFAVVLLGMLLTTPSGWVYYLPLAAGPIAAVAAMRPSSRWWSAGTIALLFPYPLLAIGQPSQWATVTIASSYFWGGCALLVGVLRASRRPCAQ
jgi:hypothetical protein